VRNWLRPPLRRSPRGARRSRFLTAPFAYIRDVDREHGAVGRFDAVLRVLLLQQSEGAIALLSVVEYARVAAATDPLEVTPVILLVVDEDGDVGSSARVLDSPQLGRALRLAVDCRIERVALECEDDRDDVRPAVWRVVHFGVILPNYGKDASPDAIRRSAETAEELSFASVWATEHIMVGPEGVDPYGRVYDPLVTLGWIAGWTERMGPRHLDRADAAAQPDALGEGGRDLQELSGGHFTLGVGMGWHKDEFDFMGVEFKNRGRRADEAIRLVRALWNSERDFDGEYWSFHEATSEPHPSPQPGAIASGRATASAPRGGRPPPLPRYRTRRKPR
jgi:Luciferase-like monooxygenase